MTFKKKEKNNKLLSPEDMKKELDTGIAQGINVIDKLTQLNEGTDIKEKVLKEVVDKLFSKEHLLMISRLDNTLAYHVIKFLIIDIFYADYYYSCKMTYHLVKCFHIEKIKDTTNKTYDKVVWDNPPYEMVVTYTYPSIDNIIKRSYRRFINELLQVTISFNGKGRDELIKLYDSVNRELRNEDMNRGFLKNLGLTGK